MQTAIIITLILKATAAVVRRIMKPENEACFLPNVFEAIKELTLMKTNILEKKDLYYL